ncbi:MAG: cytochrome C biosynthesis protein [Desulfohalobiaceae bacterium]|nr:cytochrome C biosynthesis protein [Desulfohalobiaceae bacterium]
MQELFLTINAWMTSGSLIAALGCFLWGVISVALSPCHIASIPLIVGYVGGQEVMPRPRQAAGYAGLFTLGLFLTIVIIGVVCALLGRMLGEISPYWTILLGLVLFWVALDMLGVKACSLSGGLAQRFRLKGHSGAFILGLAYGIVSGSCTFGFIAPILAVITVQEKIATGVSMILLFALGHCLPIVLAGSSTALVQRVLGHSGLQSGGMWFRRLAGVLIAFLGGYFVARPFLGV